MVNEYSVMTLVVVPVRHPLSPHSQATLQHAIDVAAEHDATLSILHINLYQKQGRVTRTELKRDVESVFGRLTNAKYVVRGGFLLEETILEEVAAEGADIVVIGMKQASRWRRMLRKLLSDPDIDQYLREQLDATVITVDF